MSQLLNITVNNQLIYFILILLSSMFLRLFTSVLSEWRGYYIMVCYCVYVFPSLYSMRVHVGRLEIDHVVVVFIPPKLASATNPGLIYCSVYCLVLKSDGENDNNVG